MFRAKKMPRLASLSVHYDELSDKLKLYKTHGVIECALVVVDKKRGVRGEKPIKTNGSQVT